MNRLLFLLVLLTFLACNNANTQQATKVESPQTNTKESNEETENITVPTYDFDGLESIFNQKTDTTYVINFWATWCKPCVEELPYFVELHKAYQSKKFKLIFVSLDFPKQIQKKLIPFLQKNKLPGDMMVLDDSDANTWIPKVSEEWSGAIPATVVYNQKKRVFHEQSFENYSELNEIVAPFFR